MIYVDPYGLWRSELKDFTCGAARGVIDDMSFGISGAALGEYHAPSSFATVGYYVGTGASIVAGVACGITTFKIARSIWSFFKGGHTAYQAAKIGKCLNETHKVGKVVHEGIHTLTKAPGSSSSTLNLTKSEATCLDTLSNAGQVYDRGNLTKAGRALDKHGNRLDTVFPKASGDPISKNMQGQFQLDDILTHPRTVTKSNKFGGLNHFAPDGRGACYNADGSFRGFLQP